MKFRTSARKNTKLNPFCCSVHKLGDRLADISSSASKEFALEKAMGKMKGEWEHVRFACEPYRESGVSILAGVDDIQVKLN